MEVDEVKLPLKVLDWLLEQSSFFLKAKFDDRNYEGACVLFEKLLCGHKLKGKLQELYVELNIQSMNRWDFVTAACPYIIQCSAQLLSNRCNLGMSDRLSVAATKLLLALHWCFLEAPEECSLNAMEIVFPIKTMELFVQLLIPCARNIREEDLSFSLSNGISIWQPLWKHSCPIIPCFQRRVLLHKSGNEYSSDVTNSGLTPHCVTYFDIAILRSLSSLYLSEEGLAWCLVYVSQLLQEELFLYRDCSDNMPFLQNFRNSGKKKNVTIQKSVPFSSNSTEKPKIQSHSLDIDFIPTDECRENIAIGSEPIYLPSQYGKWLSEDGRLKHPAILDMISKVTKSASLLILETLLYILHLLIELGVVGNQAEMEKSGEIDASFELVVNCLLDLITMIGCDNNDSGVRGSKGQSLRMLEHDIFAKLLSHNSQQLGLLLELYIRKKSVSDILNFMHSFTRFCFGKAILSPTPQHGRPSIGDIGSVHSSVHSSLSYGSYSETKDRNEENLMKWIAIPLLQKLEGEEKICKEEYRDVIQKLMFYIKQHHPKSLRKMVMNGILNSFSKAEPSPVSTPKLSTNHEPLRRYANPSARAQTMSHDSRKSKHKPRSNTGYDIPSPAESGGIQKKFKKHKLNRMKGLSFNELEGSLTESIPLPDSPVISTLPRTGKQSKESPSLAKSTGSNRFRFFSKNTKRSRLGSVVYSPLGSERNSSVLTEDNVSRPSLVKLGALNEGMKQFRFITNFLSPGQVPEEALLAAMMDLKAPVLSRAALLLECCHYVHRCNTGDWNSIRPEFTNMKNAAMMFYRWGIVLGSKLDEMVAKEAKANGDGELNTKKGDQIEKNVLHEGDLASISTECPYGIKLLVCQLLLEITSFLRDNYLLSLTYRERTLTSASRSHVDNRKKSTVSLCKPGRVGGRHPMPVIAVHDEANMTVVPKRKMSGYQVISTSPKYQRKLSRKTSKAHFLQSEKYTGRPVRGNYHITSSFDDDDDIPDEATNLPWMEAVVSFIKSINTKISLPNPDMPLVKMEKSWRNLQEGFLALYKPKKVEKGFSSRRSAVIEHYSIFVDPSEEKEADPILDYIRLQLADAQHSPFSVICKAALVTDHMKLREVFPCAWQMLLHPDQYLALTAAAVVLVAANLLDGMVTAFIKNEMNSADPNDRTKAVLRFGVLWKYRYHVWIRLEKNAPSVLRVPPPKAEYTLPSPLIGRDPASVPDAPWLAGSPFPEEASETDSVHTEWYYDEERRIEAKAKRRVEKLSSLRKKYPIRIVPLSRDADTEVKKKSEDDSDEDVWTNQPAVEPDPEVIELFPPAVCAVALDLIRLMDDTALDCTGQAACNLAYNVVWQCLVDDSDLFLRTIYEKITKPEKQEEIILVLRKLSKHMPVLPPVAGTLLFNNLTGVIMYYNRTNKPGCQEKIAAVLSVLWQFVPSVSDLFLKDMKQILRKEYCDSVFMITANVPGVKEVRVSHDKQIENFTISEGQTFSMLVKECKEKFQSNEVSLVLLDKHSGYLLEKNRLVRDHFIHKRGFPTPLLKLEKMEPHLSFKQRQQSAFLMKITDIGKLNLCGSIFSTVPSQKHVTFLYTELFKQACFPRKAIESEFDLCHGRGLAKELIGLDVVLKDNWVKFICTLLENLNESITTAEENEMFLNVLNGALLLLCEDIVILRSCLAGFINLSRHFGKIFSVNGYHCILPTILRVYSHHQDNALVVEAIEFTIGQFLVLHQSPFILQLFASATPILHSDVSCQLFQSNTLEQIPSKVFFSLLESLDRKVEDRLDILSLVHGEKPIKVADPACKIENIEFNMIDIGIRLAVTVIACRPDSLRGVQMLVVLSTIMPHYFFYLQQRTEKDLLDQSLDQQEVYAKELKQLRMLVNYMKVVIQSCKHLCSLFSEEFSESVDPDCGFDDETITSKSSLLTWNWWSGLFGNIRSWFGFGVERRNLHDDSDRVSVAGDERPISYEEKCALNKFYLPRLTLLNLISDFVTNCGLRARQLRDNMRRRGQFPDVIIEKSQASIISGVLVSMLSLAPKNHEVLSNIGLQRFMLEALPSIKWPGEKEVFFRHIIDKVNKLLQRIVNRPELQDFVNWNALEIYLRGINLTICRQKELSTVPQVKELVDWSVQLILSDHLDSDSCLVSLPFITTAAKLAARLIQVNPKTYSLSAVCGDYCSSGNAERIQRFFLHWVLPLCIRLGTGRYDYPQMSESDVEFALLVILSFLSPQKDKLDRGMSFDSTSSSPELQNDLNLNTIRSRRNSSNLRITSQFYKVLFLGLKILIVAFENKLGPHWKLTAEVMESLLEVNRNEPSIWDFFHFIIEHRSPLLIHLLPIVTEKVTEEESLSNDIRSHKTRIERDLWRPGASPCKGYVLRLLLDELSEMTQKQAMHLASPPRSRRRRSYSTHNDRSMTLLQFDQQWKNYDQQTNGIDNSGDQLDGTSEVESKLRRQRSSKRVTLVTEPVFFNDAELKPVRRQISIGESSQSARPVLKRQAAKEECSNDMRVENGEIKTRDEEKTSSKPNDVENSHGADDVNRNAAKNRAFDRQRFDMIRRAKEGKSIRTNKREKWRRQYSSKYKKKMQSQISFDEEEECRVFEDDTISPTGVSVDILDGFKSMDRGDIPEDKSRLSATANFANSPSCSSDSPLIGDDSSSPGNSKDGFEAVKEGLQVGTEREGSDPNFYCKHIIYI